MSKTIELAKHLEKLHINNMYKSDFYWTWDRPTWKKSIRKRAWCTLTGTPTGINRHAY